MKETSVTIMCRHGLRSPNRSRTLRLGLETETETATGMAGFELRNSWCDTGFEELPFFIG